MIHKYQGYLIKPDKNSPTNYVIATEGQGGKIPLVLDGLFTSTGIAKRAIDTYIETKGKKKNEEATESRN